MKGSLNKKHTKTWILNWNVSTIIDVFLLNHMRVNVCEHMVMMQQNRKRSHYELTTITFNYICVNTAYLLSVYWEFHGKKQMGYWVPSGTQIQTHSLPGLLVNTENFKYKSISQIPHKNCNLFYIYIYITRSWGLSHDNYFFPHI